MSFLKKLGETAKSTASAIGTKSVELVNTGKLMVEKNNLKGKVNNKYTDIGSMSYVAYKEGIEPDQEKIVTIFREIDELEAQIAEVERKIKEEKEGKKDDKEFVEPEAEIDSENRQED
jgi:hypothetical protein